MNIRLLFFVIGVLFVSQIGYSIGCDTDCDEVAATRFGRNPVKYAACETAKQAACVVDQASAEAERRRREAEEEANRARKKLEDSVATIPEAAQNQWNGIKDQFPDTAVVNQVQTGLIGWTKDGIANVIKVSVGLFHSMSDFVDRTEEMIKSTTEKIATADSIIKTLRESTRNLKNSVKSISDVLESTRKQINISKSQLAQAEQDLRKNTENLQKIKTKLNVDLPKEINVKFKNMPAQIAQLPDVEIPSLNDLREGAQDVFEDVNDGAQDLGGWLSDQRSDLCKSNRGLNAICKALSSDGKPIDCYEDGINACEIRQLLAELESFLRVEQEQLDLTLKNYSILRGDTILMSKQSDAFSAFSPKVTAFSSMGDMQVTPEGPGRDRDDDDEASESSEEEEEPAGGQNSPGEGEDGQDDGNQGHEQTNIDINVHPGGGANRGEPAGSEQPNPGHGGQDPGDVAERKGRVEASVGRIRATPGHEITNADLDPLAPFKPESAENSRKIIKDIKEKLSREFGLMDESLRGFEDANASHARDLEPFTFDSVMAAGSKGQRPIYNRLGKQFIESQLQPNNAGNFEQFKDSLNTWSKTMRQMMRSKDLSANETRELIQAYHDVGSALGLAANSGIDDNAPLAAEKKSLAVAGVYVKLRGQQINNNPNSSQDQKDVIDLAGGMVGASAEALNNGDAEKAETIKQIAIGLADMVLSFTPVVGWGKDVYEAVTGIGLLDKKPLDGFSRSCSILGAATGGIMSKIKNMKKVAGVIGWLASKIKLGRGVKAIEVTQGVVKITEKIVDSANNWKIGSEGLAGISNIPVGAAEGVVGKFHQATEAIISFIGPNGKFVRNSADDVVILSNDGAKRVRFDLKRPYPHKNPHTHVEELIDGKWQKSGPIYPTDVPHE